QGAAKARFGVGDNGSEPVSSVLAFSAMDLISPQKCVVDFFNHSRNAVGRIETLVGIHLSCEVGVACHLPAAQVDRFKSRLDLLQRLVARQGAKSGYIFILE